MMTTFIMICISSAFSVMLLVNGHLKVLHFLSIFGMVFFIAGYFRPENETMAQIWPLLIPFMIFSAIVNLLEERD